MRRWCKNLKFKGATKAIARRRQHETIHFETENDYEIEVIKLTDILCKILADDIRKQHDPRCSCINARGAYG